MDTHYIQELTGLLKNTQITELELSTKNQYMHLVREPQAGNFTMPSHVKIAPIDNVSPVKTNMPKALIQAHQDTVTSPFVGRFYGAPDPNAKPFVETGNQVKIGDVLGFVNGGNKAYPVIATFSGIVKQIHIKEGDIVDYGRPLMLIK